MADLRESGNFKQKTVQSILNQHFKDDKTKVNTDALKLITEVMKIFVQETASRAVIQAKKDLSEDVLIDHLEKILPQLLLDF